MGTFILGRIQLQIPKIESLDLAALTQENLNKIQKQDDP